MSDLLEAGPLTKYFTNPDIAGEVFVRGGVITAVGRDGHPTVDPEPTSEPEMLAIITRLLAEADATLDVEHPIVVQRIWHNQVRAAVAIAPIASCLDCSFRIDRTTALAAMPEPWATEVVGDE